MSRADIFKDHDSTTYVKAVSGECGGVMAYIEDILTTIGG